MSRPIRFPTVVNFLVVRKPSNMASKWQTMARTIIDVGGESTRPGAEPVAADEELARVLPVIEELRAKSTGRFISIDTSKPTSSRARLWKPEPRSSTT